MAMARGSRSRWLVLLWLVVLAGVAAAVRVLRGPPTAAFDEPTAWRDGAPWPPAEEPATSDAGTPAGQIDLRPAPHDAPAEPARVPVPADQHVAWVEPFEGQCPPGYPIKAKLASGICHQPGGTMYDRTRPDRCYASIDEAVADGLRPSKR